MSVVIVGGNERMACQYMDICKNHGCKAKVYVKENGSLKKKLGTPDYLLLFTSTVSHKMMLSASKEQQCLGAAQCTGRLLCGCARRVCFQCLRNT